MDGSGDREVGSAARWSDALPGPLQFCVVCVLLNSKAVHLSKLGCRTLTCRNPFTARLSIIPHASQHLVAYLLVTVHTTELRRRPSDIIGPGVLVELGRGLVSELLCKGVYILGVPMVGKNGKDHLFEAPLVLFQHATPQPRFQPRIMLKRTAPRCT